MKIVYVMFLVLSCLPVVGGFANTTYNFDTNFTDLTTSNLSVGNLTKVGASPYEAQLSSMFWGFLFILSFGVMWIRQEDMTIPGIVGIIIGSTILTLFPADWKGLAMMLLVVSLAGLMYSLIKGRT